MFVTGCPDDQADAVKAAVAGDVPVWTVPAVEFSDASGAQAAAAVFDEHVPADEVLAALEAPFAAPVTPYAFQYSLLGKAKADKKTIVLPEGEEDRIIKAADYLLERDIVNLIIVGDKDAILARGKELGLNSLEKASLPGHGRRGGARPDGRQAVRAARQEGHDRGAGPQDADRRQLLRHDAGGARQGRRSGLRLDQLDRQHRAPGAAGHQDQARPVAGLRRVPHVLQGSCGRVRRLRDQPESERRAAGRHRHPVRRNRQGLRHRPEGRHALLLHAGFGQGPDVDLVEEATAIVKEKAPDLAVVGSIQFDAAWSPTVAATKAKGNDVAGHVNVFVFPNLCAGNIGYKAVQRSSGAIAVGPVQQGLNRPVNGPVPRRAGAGHHQHCGPDRQRSAVERRVVSAAERLDPVPADC